MKLLIPGDTVVITGDDEKIKDGEGKHASLVSLVMKVK